MSLFRAWLAFWRAWKARSLSGSSSGESLYAPALAEKWLVRLLDEVGARHGFVQAEEPPPLTEAEWQVAVERAFRSRST